MSGVREQAGGKRPPCAQGRWPNRCVGLKPCSALAVAPRGNPTLHKCCPKLLGASPRVRIVLSEPALPAKKRIQVVSRENVAPPGRSCCSVGYGVLRWRVSLLHQVTLPMPFGGPGPNSTERQQKQQQNLLSPDGPGGGPDAQEPTAPQTGNNTPTGDSTLGRVQAGRVCACEAGLRGPGCHVGTKGDARPPETASL